MVVKSQIKLIKSLQQKKFRQHHQLFVAEGVKMVQDLLLANNKVYQIFCTEAHTITVPNTEVTMVSAAEMKQISGLTTPSKVLGVFYMPKVENEVESDWVVALDGVQDPGNLGTIIRLCDWFGIATLWCGAQTVDCYNPKVLQATMGSIARVKLNYVDLQEKLQKTTKPVYGAFMEGENVYESSLPKAGILVMGNEGKGISPSIEALITAKISIPQFGTQTAESLNVATATSILLNEIRRPKK